MGGRQRKKNKTKNPPNHTPNPAQPSVSPEPAQESFRETPAKEAIKQDKKQPKELAPWKERPRRDSLVAIGTLFAGIVVATIYFFQLIAMREQVKLTDQTISNVQKNFNDANRPFVGVNQISVGHLIYGKPGVFERKTKETNQFAYTIEFKNFGPLPGTNVVGTYKIWLGGKELEHIKEASDRPFTMFPTQTFYQGGTIGSDDYPSVVGGQKTLKIEVIMEYDGPGGHYTYCDWHQYSSVVGSFIKLGTGCDIQ